MMPRASQRAETEAQYVTRHLVITMTAIVINNNVNQ